MYYNTYKKAFIAKAAIECMKEVVRHDLEHGVINNDTEGEELESAVVWQAQRAALMAKTLADHLEDRFDDHQTTFFDPQDQPDNVGQCVADAIREYTEKYFDADN